MANKIVKDSGLAIFVKEVQVLAANGDITTLPAINDFFRVGAVAGLVGDQPRQGDDGAYYTTIDTAALVRVSGVTGTFTDKAPVYLTSGGAITGTATSNTCVGYADRAKTASAAGDLWVQLIPSATGA